MKRAYLSFGMVMAVILVMLSACSTPKDIAYFQDFNPGKSIMVQNPVEIKFRPDDEIRILVSSDRPELSAQFSLSTKSSSGDEGSRLIQREIFVSRCWVRFMWQA